MPLPDLIEEAVAFFGNLSVGQKPDNLPPDLRIVAGPWLSDLHSRFGSRPCENIVFGVSRGTSTSQIALYSTIDLERRV